MNSWGEGRGRESNLAGPPDGASEELQGSASLGLRWRGHTQEGQGGLSGVVRRLDLFRERGCVSRASSRSPFLRFVGPAAAEAPLLLLNGPRPEEAKVSDRAACLRIVPALLALSSQERTLFHRFRPWGGSRQGEHSVIAHDGEGCFSSEGLVPHSARSPAPASPIQSHSSPEVELANLFPPATQDSPVV